MEDLKVLYEKIYLIKFINKEDLTKFSQLNWKTEISNDNTIIKVFVKIERIN